MKSKQVLHQSALIHVSCAVLILLLNNDLTQAQLEQRKPRPDPAGAVLRVQQVSPELEAILQKWAQESAKIKKLEGNHTRLEYDEVFQVEKRSEGKFYYEQPDKGRIDIAGMKVPEGAQGNKRNKNGKPFKLASGENERWICDGKRIFAVDEDEKTYEVYPIPLERRGANIMEGPLPFLFGMPADTAKKRYFLRLLQNTPQQIVIAVKPRRRADAANYREAKVILNPKTYLPNAVLLDHPSGNQSTVYVFKNVVANKNKGFFDGLFGKDRDPFRPDLNKYRLEGKVAAVPENNERPQKQIRQVNAAPNQVQQVVFRVPLMIGKDYKTAQETLEKMGFKWKLHKGVAAKEPGQRKFYVYKQKPQAGTPAKRGDEVNLLLYTDPKNAKE